MESITEELIQFKEYANSKLENLLNKYTIQLAIDVEKINKLNDIAEDKVNFNNVSILRKQDKEIAELRNKVDYLEKQNIYYKKQCDSNKKEKYFENIVEPIENIVEPIENIVETTENIVEPIENIVEPIENIVEPSKNIVEPTNQSSKKDKKDKKDKKEFKLLDDGITYVNEVNNKVYKKNGKKYVCIGKLEDGNVICKKS